MLSLLPYQEIGKNFLVENKRAYLCDEMGLGKTCQFLLAAQELVSQKIVGNNVLICTTAVNIPNMLNEIEKWGVTFNATVISYGSLHKVIDNKYPLVIADEWHKCKNPQAKRTKLFFKLANKAKYVWGTSGTPITRCTTDLYPMLYFAQVFNGNYFQFADRYAETNYVRARGRLIKQYKGGKNLKELKKLMKGFMLRRFYKDVYNDLPGKNVVEVFLDKEKTAKYESYITTLSDALSKQSYAGIDKEDVKQLATLRRELGEGKVKHAVNFVNSILEDKDEQIIIFAYHRAVIQKTIVDLDAVGYKAAPIYGGQNEHERKRIFDAWKNKNIDVLVLSLDAASEGLTLTEANKAVFIELPWNPSTLDQAIARVHRIGQKKLVNIFVLLRGNSLDMAVKGTILNKRNVINETIGKGI